jgi:hypothetical protein
MSTVIGLDLGHTGTVEAEHWLAELPPVPGLVACTHLVHSGQRRVVITLEVPDGSALPTLPPTPSTLDGKACGDGGVAALAAVDAHTAHRSGRAVRFPGSSELTGIMTVAELLARSAITRVRVIGGIATEPDPDTAIDTRDFVRPQWMDGRLTLVATPAPAGQIAPFEVPNPTPCCGGSH